MAETSPAARWHRERQAYDSFSNLIEQAEKVRALFRAADLEEPEPLRRLFGEVENGAEDTDDEPQMQVPPLQEPDHPVGWEPGWIWVPFSQATPQVAVLAIMRHRGGPMTARDIHTEMKALGFETPLGSVHNIGLRLDGNGSIERADDGWRLVNREVAPIIADDYVWGPLSVFASQEIAAHRRLHLLHLLKTSPDGMQTMQVVKFLRRLELFEDRRLGEIGKDLVEDDLSALVKAKKVKRNMRSKKWEAI